MVSRLAINEVPIGTKRIAHRAPARGPAPAVLTSSGGSNPPVPARHAPHPQCSQASSSGRAVASHAIGSGSNPELTPNSIAHRACRTFDRRDDGQHVESSRPGRWSPTSLPRSVSRETGSLHATSGRLGDPAPSVHTSSPGSNPGVGSGRRPAPAVLTSIGQRLGHQPETLGVRVQLPLPIHKHCTSGAPKLSPGRAVGPTSRGERKTACYIGPREGPRAQRAHKLGWFDSNTRLQEKETRDEKRVNRMVGSSVQETEDEDASGEATYGVGHGDRGASKTPVERVRVLHVVPASRRPRGRGGGEAPR